MKKKIIPVKIIDWFNSLSEDTKKEYFSENVSLETSSEKIIETYNTLKSTVKLWFDNLPDTTKRKYFGGFVTFRSSYDVIMIAYEEAKKNNGILKRK